MTRAGRRNGFDDRSGTRPPTSSDGKQSRSTRPKRGYVRTEAEEATTKRQPEWPTGNQTPKPLIPHNLLAPASRQQKSDISAPDFDDNAAEARKYLKGRAPPAGLACEFRSLSAS